MTSAFKRTMALLKSLKPYCEAKPGKAIGGIVVLTALFASVFVISQHYLLNWRTYVIKPVGITVVLPAAPVTLPKSGSGNGIVYQARVAEIAVVLASFKSDVPDSDKSQSLIRQAMAYLWGKPELENLRYKITPTTFQDKPGWRVFGVFSRQGVPGRLAGVFVAEEQQVSHVLCFFSTTEGARMADKILRSVQFHQKN